MCQWGANRNPWASCRMWFSPTPHLPYPLLKRGVKKSSYQISAYHLEVDPNVNGAHFRIIGWLWSDTMNNRTAVAKPANECTQIEHSFVVVEWPDHHFGDDIVLCTPSWHDHFPFTLNIWSHCLMLVLRVLYSTCELQVDGFDKIWLIISPIYTVSFVMTWSLILF